MLLSEFVFIVVAALRCRVEWMPRLLPVVLSVAFLFLLILIILLLLCVPIILMCITILLCVPIILMCITISLFTVRVPILLGILLPHRPSLLCIPSTLHIPLISVLLTSILRVLLTAPLSLLLLCVP